MRISIFGRGSEIMHFRSHKIYMKSIQCPIVRAGCCAPPRGSYWSLSFSQGIFCPFSANDTVITDNHHGVRIKTTSGNSYVKYMRLSLQSRVVRWLWLRRATDQLIWMASCRNIEMQMESWVHDLRSYSLHILRRHRDACEWSRIDDESCASRLIH